MTFRRGQVYQTGPSIEGIAWEKQPCGLVYILSPAIAVDWSGNLAPMSTSCGWEYRGTLTPKDTAKIESKAVKKGVVK